MRAKQVFGYPEAQCLIFMMRHTVEGSIMCWWCAATGRGAYGGWSGSEPLQDAGVVLVTSGPERPMRLYRDCYGLYGFHSAGDFFRPCRHLIDWL